MNKVCRFFSAIGGFDILTDDEWEASLQTNLLAPTRLDKGFLPHMIRRRTGIINHIASIQARLPLSNSTLPYAVAKAASVNYSKNLFNEVMPKGVRALTVSFGWTMVGSSEKMMKRIAEKENKTTE